MKCALASSIVTISTFFLNVAFFTQSEEDLSLNFKTVNGKPRAYLDSRS